MSRYIDAEKLKEEIRKNFDNLKMRIIINTIINEMPTADVKPVVRGEWIYDMSIGDEPYCSACKTFQEKISRFCPRCGADMRGEKND